MNILALDTTMKACSAAVLANNGEQHSKLFRSFENRSRGHAEVIIPMIDALMKKAEISYRDLSRIAVTIGPGTFTGIRVGIAAARGISLAADIPVVSCTSLKLLAAAERRQISGKLSSSIAVVSDARRDQVYFAHYGQNLEEVVAPCLTSMEVVNSKLIDGSLPSEKKIVIVGSAASKILEINSSEFITLGNSGSEPDATVLVDMAAELPVSVQPVQPLYLREADAKPQIGKSIPWQL